jgi:hypothetical protein
LFDLFYDQLLIIILIAKDIKYKIKRPVTARKRMELAAGFGIGGYCSLGPEKKSKAIELARHFEN